MPLALPSSISAHGGDAAPQSLPLTHPKPSPASAQFQGHLFHAAISNSPELALHTPSFTCAKPVIWTSHGALPLLALNCGSLKTQRHSSCLLGSVPWRQGLHVAHFQWGGQHCRVESKALGSDPSSATISCVIWGT